MITLNRRAIIIIGLLVVVQMVLYYLFFMNTDHYHATITKLSPSGNNTISPPTHKPEIPTVLETLAPTPESPSTSHATIESTPEPTTENPTTTTTAPPATTTETPTETPTQPETSTTSGPTTTTVTPTPTFPAPKNIILYVPPQDERQSVDSVLDRTVDVPFFSDLTEKLRGSARTHQYSRFRCIGDDNENQANADRTCVFMNMCYDRYIDQFYFYRKNKRPVLYDAKFGPKYDFKIDYGLLRLTYFDNYGFDPEIIEGTIPTQDVTYVKPLHILFRHWKIPTLNLGHFLWEDVLGSYAAIMRLGLQDEDGIIMDLNGDDEGKLFKKFQPFFKGISNKPLVDFKTYVNTDLNQTRHICFEQLQAGGATGVFQKQHRRYNVGREQQFRQFRDNILRRNGVDPDYIPTKHQIVVTKKSDKKFKRDIANLDEVVKFLQETYPTIETKVVDFSKMTIKEQLELMINTTIYITPAGGVSMMAPFLPVGAHALFMDFDVTHPMYGFEKGESGSMEGAFWNHWAHIKRDYYQVRKEGEDYVFDHKGATDARWFASVLIKPDRLKVLIDAALEDMSA